jgi:hypothetical protein
LIRDLIFGAKIVIPAMTFGNGAPFSRSAQPIQGCQ